jgi:hypothetical protein
MIVAELSLHQVRVFSAGTGAVVIAAVVSRQTKNSPSFKVSGIRIPSPTKRCNFLSVKADIFDCYF